MAEITTKPNGKAVVQWKEETITITAQDVKNFICPLATGQEVGIFLKTCQSLQLNPFANECFLIKYDSREKAAFVIAIDSYLKAAEANPNYDGCEAGIVLKDSGSRLELREGALLLDEDRPRLAGGWARVYRKDRSRPTYVAVNKNECIKYTAKGTPTAFWSEPKQPWMLRKSALKRALVEAFPSLFAGTLATAEIESGVEGTLPAAFHDGDDPDWAKFWVRAKDELDLTKDAAHRLLGVGSLKDLLEQGKNLEDIWLMLVESVRASTTAEAYPEPMDEDFEAMFNDEATEVLIDKGWLNESLKELKDWNATAYVKQTYPNASGKTLGEAIESLSSEQRQEFAREVQKRLDTKAK